MCWKWTGCNVLQGNEQTRRDTSWPECRFRLTHLTATLSPSERRIACRTSPRRPWPSRLPNRYWLQRTLMREIQHNICMSDTCNTSKVDPRSRCVHVSSVPVVFQRNRILIDHIHARHWDTNGVDVEIHRGDKTKQFAGLSNARLHPPACAQNTAIRFDHKRRSSPLPTHVHLTDSIDTQ